MAQQVGRVRRVICLAALALGVMAAPAHAATFKVNTHSDSSVAGGCTTASACSLRDAVSAANATGGADTISLLAGRYELVSGSLQVAAPVTFDGVGARDTVIDANGTGSVITDNSTSALTVKDLTITGGAAGLGDGGGIFSDGDLTLDHVTITGNSSSVRGGGVATPTFLLDGALVLTPVTITASTISNNTVTGVGNGIGGGIATSGDLTLTNSTVTGNRVTSIGNNEASGIETQAGTTTLVNSTIAGNQTAGTLNVASAGITDTPAFPSQLVARNTIVAGNKAGTATVNCALTDATPTTANNISDDSTCHFSDSGSQQGANPRLKPLANNGGPTDTLSFAAGAPPYNRGTGTGCPTTDQRGNGRPKYGACDVGALELAPPTASTGSASDVTTSESSARARAAAAGSAATLTGIAGNPLAFSGSAFFQIGTTTGYGRTVSVGTLAALVSGRALAARVGSLTPGTTYHFRLVASNIDGTAAGRDVTFRTPTAAQARRSRPRVSLRGVRGTGRACVRGDFSVRIRARVTSGSRLRSVRVRLDRRLIKRTRRSSFRVRIHAKRLRRGRHRISVRATDRGGRTRVVSRTFRRCAPPAPVRVPRFTG